MEHLFTIKLATSEIQVRHEDGYINATQMCKAGGKEFKHWKALKSTKILIRELTYKQNIMYDHLVNSKQGKGGCSWIHPDLCIPLAQWISPKFGLSVSKYIEEWRSMSTNNEKRFWSDLIDCVVNHPFENRQEEKKWQLLVAANEDGEIEVETRFGRIDILTSSKVIEIKTARLWKHAIGQVLCYSRAFKDRLPAIYLFDCENAPRKEIDECCFEFKIEVKYLT